MSQILPTNRTNATETQSPPASTASYGAFDSSRLTISAGVAIFHLATARVVLCYHTLQRGWFLPKGRRDVHEESGCGAEREGYEESGYLNRLLPIPMRHRQPQPHIAPSGRNPPFFCEPIWTVLMPEARDIQYILFWYIAETVPPEIETLMKNPVGAGPVAFRQTPRFPASMTLAERIALEPQGYEPIKHENTAVNAEEELYESKLVPIEEAMQKLGPTSVSADVVRQGWEAVLLRDEMEKNPQRTVPL